MTNSQILDAINQNIKRNENKEITGVILNSVLRMLLDFVNQGFITFSDIIQLLADSKAVNVIGSINSCEFLSNFGIFIKVITTISLLLYLVHLL